MAGRAKSWRRRLKLFGIVVVVAVIGVLGLPYLIWRPVATRLAAVGDDGGVLIYVVGWNGPVGRDREVLYALRGAGCGMSMETFDWTGGYRSLMALWRAQHSAEPALRLARRIEAVELERPGRPIFVIADSSGCGVALAALAGLPGDVHVKTVILSSPAISPRYDLGAALRHVDGEMVSFNSDRDFRVLWLGTTIFGTVDGHHVPAAGRVGFVVPAGTVGYEKLRQISYDPSWAERYGNSGGHGQALLPRFAGAVIAPMLGE